MEQLPLFVLVIIIFQRFTPGALWLSQRDTTKVEVGDKSFYINNNSQQSQTHAKRAVGSPTSTSRVSPIVQSDEQRIQVSENLGIEDSLEDDDRSGELVGAP